MAISAKYVCAVTFIRLRTVISFKDYCPFNPE